MLSLISNMLNSSASIIISLFPITMTDADVRIY